MDPITAALLITAGAIGYAITQDGKVVPIDPSRLANSEIPFAKKIEIDTSAAHDNEEYQESGGAIFVKNPSGPSTTVSIRFNNKEGELFDLTALRNIKGPFGKFFITNDAGSGILTLIITKGFAFEFTEAEIITAGTIDMALNDLNDVSAASPSDSDVIKWSSSAGAWLAAELLAAELPDHKTKHQDGGGDEISIAGLSGEPAQTVNKTLYNANSILIAVSDDVPEVLAVATSRIIGRKATGQISALTAAETLVVAGLTATAAELNIMDGVTATAVELNYVSGVSSAIQTQIDLKVTIATFNAHKTRHQDGGGDEISIAGLSGEPADVVNKSLFDAHTILMAVSDNTPVALTIAASRILGRKATGNIGALTDAEVATIVQGSLDHGGIAGLTDDDHTQYALKSLFDAHSVLIAVSDNTPVVLTIAASTIVGRKSTGNIVALTKADILTIINVADGADVTGSSTPQAHKTSHQDGGGDEISVTGLAGLLAADQHVLNSEVLLVAAALVHKTRHQDGGADEISIQGLAGTGVELTTHKAVKAGITTLGHAIVEAASDIDIGAGGELTLGGHKTRHQDGGNDEISIQGLAGNGVELTAHKLVKSANATLGHVVVETGSDIDVNVDGKLTLGSHKTRHQDGGDDEISVTGLSGLLTADQHVLDAEVLAVAAALAHKTRHQDGGADEISIQGLEGNGVELTAHKLVKSANAVLGHVIVETTSLIDVNVDGKLTLGTHASTHQDGGTDEISVTGLSGLLANDQHVLDAEVKLIKLDDFATPDDNTDLNASATRHGLLLKLDSVNTNFMDGTGNWSAPNLGSSLVISTGTYSGDNADNRAIAHGLGIIPKLVFIMCTNTGGFEKRSGFLANAEFFISTAGHVDAVTARTTTNFYVPQNAQVDLNVSGGTYSWVAIA